MARHALKIRALHFYPEACGWPQVGPRSCHGSLLFRSRRNTKLVWNKLIARSITFLRHESSFPYVFHQRVRPYTPASVIGSGSDDLLTSMTLSHNEPEQQMFIPLYLLVFEALNT